MHPQPQIPHQPDDEDAGSLGFLSGFYQDSSEELEPAGLPDVPEDNDCLTASPFPGALAAPSQRGINNQPTLAPGPTSTQLTQLQHPSWPCPASPPPLITQQQQAEDWKRVSSPAASLAQQHNSPGPAHAGGLSTLEFSEQGLAAASTAYTAAQQQLQTAEVALEMMECVWTYRDEAGQMQGPHSLTHLMKVGQLPPAPVCGCCVCCIP